MKTNENDLSRVSKRLEDLVELLDGLKEIHGHVEAARQLLMMSCALYTDVLANNKGDNDVEPILVRKFEELKGDLGSFDNSVDEAIVISRLLFERCDSEQRDLLRQR